MGRPWHIFKVAPAFAVAGGFAGTLLRCLVWAGAIAARSVTLVTREREATSNFISLPPGLILGLGRHYRREPLSRLERAGGLEMAPDRQARTICHLSFANSHLVIWDRVDRDRPRPVQQSNGK